MNKPHANAAQARSMKLTNFSLLRKASLFLCISGIQYEAYMFSAVKSQQQIAKLHTIGLNLTEKISRGNRTYEINIFRALTDVFPWLD